MHVMKEVTGALTEPPRKPMSPGGFLLDPRRMRAEGASIRIMDLAARMREAEGWRLPGEAIVTARSARIAYRTHAAVRMLSESVDVDVQRRGGRPVLKDTRFKVSQLLAQISEGDSFEDLVRELDLDDATIRTFLRALSVILDRPYES